MFLIKFTSVLFTQGNPAAVFEVLDQIEHLYSGMEQQGVMKW